VVLTDLHIYILEVEAALEGLADWVQKHPTPADRVTLVVDNAAAAFTLRYGFSNNRVANRLMQTPANRANLRRVEDVVLVISQDNPSDCCSRNGPEDWKRAGGCRQSHASFDERWQRLNRCLSSRTRGWNWASMSHEKWIAEEEETLRHVPRAEVSRPGDGDPLTEDSRDDPYILQDAEDDFGSDGPGEA
jgi:hypothetical protein